MKRTWAPCGQTPTIRTSLEHNQRQNLIGVLCLTPCGRKLALHVRSHWCHLTGDQVMAFLRCLLRDLRGPIVMLWDRHPIHKRRKVAAFLAQHSRLRAYWFPTGAPELNPVEHVWTQMSEFTANTAPRDVSELKDNVNRALARTRRSEKRLWACIYGSALPWRRKN